MIDRNIRQNVLALLKMVGATIHARQRDAEWRRIVSPKGFKTGGDIAAHAAMVRGLNSITPDIPVFSEEHPHSIDERPPLYWLIDPIDGTSSWHGGFDGYVSQLALIHESTAIMGAIYWPAMEKMFCADMYGIFVDGQPVVQPELNEPPVLVDNYPSPQGVAAMMIERMPDLRYRECGSLGLKSVLALIGEADLFVKDVRVRDWDFAPVMAFVNFGWGVMTDLAGQKLSLGKKIEFDEGLIVSHDAALCAKASDVLVGVH